MKSISRALVIIMLSHLNIQAQTHKPMNKGNNPLLCDPAEGICGLPADTPQQTRNPSAMEKSIKLIYFTDPICSSCWGIEPQLRKLKLEYGNALDIEYRMGGLLPDWSYNSGGISKPSDVAHHWDEVSLYYDMPIDGDLWLEDPLHSSFPPSIAFKAAQIQDQGKALHFLRTIREMVFLQKKNITRWEYLLDAAQQAGLNLEQFKSDYEHNAKTLFEEDLALAKTMGVRGFPTMFFIHSSGNTEVIYGSKPYAFYEAAALKLKTDLHKDTYPKDWQTLFTRYSSLTAREYAELSGISRTESEQQLNELTRKGLLTQLHTKNGALWRRP